MEVLVVGAGVAGLATALELGVRGHRCTVVERAPRLRSGGSPIDVRGAAIDVVDRLGLLAGIRARRLRMTEQGVFVDASGTVLAPLPVAEFNDSADDIEIAREDLAMLLRDALPAGTELRFGDTVRALADDGAGVDVRFASGAARRFDVVVGADGVHSAVRALTFGPERDYARQLGVYVAIAALPGEVGVGGPNPTYSVPGATASIMRYGERALAVLMFRSGPLVYDHHDLDAQRRILAGVFAGQHGWRIPELLAATHADPELYFDAATQIHLPTWHRGRVVLVGDAAHAASGLSGRGTSLALLGAHSLATAVHECPDPAELPAAFARYAQRRRAHVATAQATAGTGIELVVPATAAAIAARNERLRAAVTSAAVTSSARTG